MISTLSEFVKAPKSLLIAAAGHGKTQAIAECVQLCPVGKCQLILTHTHAGIASIKAKMRKLEVDVNKYHIETITSFAQQYVFAFARTDSLPEVTDKVYFHLVLDTALKLFSNPHILDVIRLSYSGLFVDEYQDCDETQHKIVMNLGRVLPTHILGDELQGIFGFNSELVDFERDLPDFIRFDLLRKPWRWYQEGNCKELGDRILDYRTRLMSDNKTIQLVSDSSSHIEVCLSHYEALDYNPKSNYYRQLAYLLRKYDSESLLVIFPSYKDEKGILRGQIWDRVKCKERFDISNRFLLVEAIDENAFYSNAKRIDDLIQGITRAKNKEKKICEVIEELSFSKTELNLWFERKNDYRLITRQKENRVKSDKLAEICNKFIEHPTKQGVLDLINFFRFDCGIKPKRHEIVSSILLSLNHHPDNEKTVFQSMRDLRNSIRKDGRKIQGRCIGTTLLTKGLEFDNVIILDAHRFEDSKNFYVAISRACKNLVIITKQSTLVFNT